MRTRFGFSVEKNILKKASKISDSAIEKESVFSGLSDNELINKHNEIFATPFSKIDKGEAFALFGEVIFRRTGMRPYGVQYIGAYALFKGAVSEMKTGEGKTLVALIASYLSYLNEEKVHVITVNNYLAERDAFFAHNVFSFLGINVMYLHEDSNNPAMKANQYKSADIVYASNTTMGFDYLRSNIVKNYNEKIIDDIGDCFAIIDEVDSVLIDEAKTPLIISGEADAIDYDVYKSLFSIAKEMDGVTINKEEEIADNQAAIDKLIKGVEEKHADKDFVADRKTKNTHLTEKGYQTLEEKLIEFNIIENRDELYRDNSKIRLVKDVESCLSALHVYRNGVDYMVGKNDANEDVVKLIDQSTGRVMEGRMLSNGMHQAIEIKEGVSISKESKNLAEIAYQNFFRLYKKISGMTGTAYEDKKEIEDIYGMCVCQIPTRKPVIREDMEDVIFVSKEKKILHTVDKIIETHQKGQPILVGTHSVNDSEILASMLRDKGVRCNVLNAKPENQARESEIIAEAGRKGAITISTSMAGRGTDILLGGSLSHMLEGIEDEAEREKLIASHSQEQQEVIGLGGLFVLGFERSISRRVDDQLKGRAGRQGDPGASRFFLSLDDDLFVIFGADKLLRKMEGAIFGEGDYITESTMLSNMVKRSQKKAGGQEADHRMSLLKFDDVIDKQRRKFYAMRDGMLQMSPDYIRIEDGRYQSAMIEELEGQLNYHITPICKQYEDIAFGFDTEDEEFTYIYDIVMDKMAISLNLVLLKEKLESNGNVRGRALFETILDTINNKKDDMSNFIFYHRLREEKLHSMDAYWIHLLEESASIKKSVHLRGYAQKKPEDEYRKETWKIFNEQIIGSSTFDALIEIIKD